MKNLMRTLTLSAAALAALVAAPKSDAQQFRRGETHETLRGSPGRGNHGNPSYGNPSRGNTGHGNPGHGNPGYGNRNYGNRSYGNRGYGGYNRGYVHPQARFYGHPYISPFRVFAGSRFYSDCPGPGYIYIDELGWVFPPFAGALWVPRFDHFGVRIGGFWR